MDRTTRVLESSRAQCLLRQFILLLRDEPIPLIKRLSIQLRVPVQALMGCRLLLGLRARRRRRSRSRRLSRSCIRCRRTLDHLGRRKVLRHPRLGIRCTVHVSYHCKTDDSGQRSYRNPGPPPACEPPSATLAFWNCCHRGSRLLRFHRALCEKNHFPAPAAGSHVREDIVPLGVRE
jgi:hypothetical protein